MPSGGGSAEKLEHLSGCSKEFVFLEDLEQLEKSLVDWNPSLLFVLADSAVGMESVYRAKGRRPNLPVFWFSDDELFGVQSYRLDCAYFSTKPVTEEKLLSALRRCERLGIVCRATLKVSGGKRI